jgi:hypothetical protein
LTNSLNDEKPWRPELVDFTLEFLFAGANDDIEFHRPLVVERKAVTPLLILNDVPSKVFEFDACSVKPTMRIRSVSLRNRNAVRMVSFMQYLSISG